MRLFISADIEGITGVSRWEDTMASGSTYPYFTRQMTREVGAACSGALKAGAEYILVKDAHEDAKNLIPDLLPQEVKIISGWSNHPFCMVEGLDDTFDGVMFIGYHSGAHSNDSPISHTLSPKKIRSIAINGELVDEFKIHKYIADMLGVPVILVTGDSGVIRSAKKMDETIKTVATSEGFGGAMISIHPDAAVRKIEEAARYAVMELKNNKQQGKRREKVKIDFFELKIEFKSHKDAYKFSFYPGASQVSETTVVFCSKNYMDILIFLGFIS